MLPPACAPKSPESLAWSLKLSPTVPEAGSWVVAIAGWAWAISTGSSAQPLVASFFFNDPATTEIYSLSLHDALPISWGVEYSPSPSTLTGPSEASTPPSEASQLLLE